MIDPRQPDFSCTPVDARRPAFGYARRDTSAAPVVSVITPCFNPGQELRETARCVLGQSLQAFEWIIIDDGSTDEQSRVLLKEIVALDDRIRLIELGTNQGPSAARNAGVRESTTELVFQLDADDLIEATTLEKCAWHLASHPEHAFVKGFTVGFGSREYLWAKGFCANERFLKENQSNACSMIRRSVFLEVGGYDDAIVDGMEDWDFWLLCASKGYWGTTIGEYLDWYRCRPCHSERWADWDQGERQRTFSDMLATRYASLHIPGAFPNPKPTRREPLEAMRRDLPFTNPLTKSSRRLLMILPWLRMGGADKFNLDLVEQLTRRGWEVTIATTNGTINRWQPQFARFTPDIFVMPELIGQHDQPAMLRSLIESRRPDVVMVTNAEAAYLYLPYLRSVCPEPAYVDYNHMEEDYWKSGGHPRSGVGNQDLLELNITASHHLKDWMVEHGADAARVEVATINVDPGQWKPDPPAEQRVRDRLDIAPDATVILYAGRICAQKQPQVFVRTLALLAKHADAQSVEFVAIVAGDGEDRPALEEALAREGLTDRVRMLGEVTSNDMRELMAASDIFFLPSRWEGIALVIYEAMAAGAVVVGAVVGGQLELVTPQCGVLLPKAAPGRELDDEPEPYAQALLELMRDPDRKAAMARAARARIEAHFHLDAMGDRMEALLEQAIELRASDPRQAPDIGFGRELGDRAIESLRLLRVADRLWQDNKALRERLKAAMKATPRAPTRPTPTPHAATMQAKAGRGQHRPTKRAPQARKRRQAAARAELAQIEQSRAWRLVRALRMNPVSRGIARLRHGPGWHEYLTKGSPVQRLARIKASRSYRFIVRFKRSWLGQIITRKPDGAKAARPTVVVADSMIEPKASLNGTARTPTESPVRSSTGNTTDRPPMTKA